MSKVLSFAPTMMHSAGRFFRSQIVQDVSALWAVATFILAIIYFSELAAALVLMARAV